jgi:hypothetical protein
MTIAAEVLAALQEAGAAVGDGPLVLMFTRKGEAANPWDAAGAETTYELTAIDEGIKEVYASGSAATRKARFLMVDAIGTAPAIGDSVAIAGASHDVLAVMPEAPGGIALYYMVEIST